MPGYFCFFGGYEVSRMLLTPKGQTKDDIGKLGRKWNWSIKYWSRSCQFADPVSWLPDLETGSSAVHLFWHNYIQSLLGDSECMFQPDQITSLAQDRKGWKKPVVACSTVDRWWWCQFETISVAVEAPKFRGGQEQKKLGGYFLKTHQFGFIFLLILDNFATFLDFSLLVFFLRILGGMSPSLKILGRTCPPPGYTTCE